MTRAIFIGLAVLAVIAGGIWWFTRRPAPQEELLLYGNVDLREVDLAFNNSERIIAVTVREGDRVKSGQLVAQVDTSRLRPEEQQAAANVALAAVDLGNARRQYDRLARLARASGGRGVSQQDVDNAKAALDAAAARRQAADSQLALLKRQLLDADLFAPIDATVRTRVLEPGEMASPQRPVLALAVTDPKWIRVYVTETDLGKVHTGMPAWVGVDSFPGTRFSGWVGFVSPIAEFTPKNIETDDLRTSLVYEVRVFVKDPADRLPLGMPATVHMAPAKVRP